jgi:hypothetical protein
MNEDNGINNGVMDMGLVMNGINSCLLYVLIIRWDKLIICNHSYTIYE